MRSIALFKKTQEATHLLLIVASLLAVAFAGNYADASTTASANTEMKYARSEIERAESLLGDLNERALGETDAASLERLAKKLVVLDKRLVDARASLGRAVQAPKNPIAQEDLRASVMILDEASNRALNAALDADSRAEQLQQLQQPQQAGKVQQITSAR